MSDRILDVVEAQDWDVDSKEHVIKDVKVLGKVSGNGRRYTSQALKDGASLYEGIRVNFDHSRMSKDRRYADRFGKLVNVRVTESGLRGDLRYNPKHRLAEQFVWDAENTPENVGLSHDARGKVVRKGGETLVERIISVKSVDIVADPATTRSLFESLEEPMSQTFTVNQIVDAAKPETYGVKLLREMIEGDEEMGGVEVSAPSDADMGGEPSIKSAFIEAVVAAVKDDKLDLKATIAKIKDILKAQEKIDGPVGSGGSETPAESKEGDDKEKDAKESLQRRINELETRDEVRELCESLAVKPTAEILKAAARMDSKEERTRLIESMQKIPAKHQPRSGTRITESGDKKPEGAKDSKEFAKRLIG